MVLSVNAAYGVHISYAILSFIAYLSLYIFICLCDKQKRTLVTPFYFVFSSSKWKSLCVLNVVFIETQLYTVNSLNNTALEIKCWYVTFIEHTLVFHLFANAVEQSADCFISFWQFMGIQYILM